MRRAGLRRRKRLLVSGTVLAIGSLVLSSCGTDLGSLGGRNSWGAGINDAGVVVGTATTADERQHAFVLDPADGHLRQLGPLDNRTAGATAVNDAGLIVGSVASHAVTWSLDRPDEFHDLGGLFTGTNPSSTSEASAVNNHGIVVCAATTPSGAIHATRWDTHTGTVTDLGSLGGQTSIAYGVNDAGLIIGMAYGVDDRHGFVWDPAVGTMARLSGDDLSSWAFGINDHNQVVGTLELIDQGLSRAVVWDLDAGTRTQIDDFGVHSVGRAINDRGDVVGIAFRGTQPNGNAKLRAFRKLHDAAAPTDFGTTGGEQSEAYAINNEAITAGTSTLDNGDIHATRWVLHGDWEP